MNIVLIGAMVGGISGAVGHLVAGKIHGNQLGEKLYPLYSASLFAVIVLSVYYFFNAASIA